ncbi:MAG: COX15/CtaA family protein [Woeseiaceae bacterium]|nr:COX15/CtaA family protein [Woeseiaceae bacterium]
MTTLPNTERRDKSVATWLLVCCGLVFAMVVLGGVTRLTGSGLSMAEWRPIMGALPPLTEAEWQRVFDIYKQTPEFLHVNSHMDVEDFKGIFWLEYLHRLLGRLIGFAFAVPLAWFAVRRYIPVRQLPWYLFLLALGAAQAFIGKIMVASGQVDAPAVSHYKLTAHLAAAFLVYSLMLWSAMNLLRPRTTAAPHPWFRQSVTVTALVSVTILSGGFVAGLKAGKIFNTFPMMGDYWIPPGVMALSPGWRNFFDNPAMVQLDHRILAITTFIVVVTFGLRLWRSPLGDRARLGVFMLLASVFVQVSLGILTLVLHVPVALAAAHQAVGLLLLTSALFLTHALAREPETRPARPAKSSTASAAAL